MVYGMSLQANEDLAMILPIPVLEGSGEKALQFLSFAKYPDFFEHLSAGFPEVQKLSRSDSFAAAAVALPEKLEVVSVGSFEASFVPHIADFARLDERFRLPNTEWDKLPGYASFGFAVFKLKAGQAKVHPMAFTFPSSIPEVLFFPTLHIHDGEVHEKAEFDHSLFCQAAEFKSHDWRESPSLASEFCEVWKTNNAVLPKHHVYRQQLHGMLVNSDRITKCRAVV